MQATFASALSRPMQPRGKVRATIWYFVYNIFRPSIEQGDLLALPVLWSRGLLPPPPGGGFPGRACHERCNFKFGVKRNFYFLYTI